MELGQADTDRPDVDDGGPGVVVQEGDVEGGEGGEGGDQQLQPGRHSGPSEVSLNLQNIVLLCRHHLFTSSRRGNISKYLRSRSDIRTFILVRRGQSRDIFSIVLTLNNFFQFDIIQSTNKPFGWLPAVNFSLQILVIILKLFFTSHTLTTAHLNSPAGTRHQLGEVSQLDILTKGWLPVNLKNFPQIS